MPWVDGFLAQKSREPGVVKLGEFGEVATLVGHYPRIDVLDYPLGIRHPRDFLPISLVGIRQLIWGETPVILPLVEVGVCNTQELIDDSPIKLNVPPSHCGREVNTSDQVVLFADNDW